MIGLPELGYGLAALVGSVATYVGTRDKGRLKADQQDHAQMVQLVTLLNTQLQATSDQLRTTSSVLESTQSRLLDTQEILLETRIALRGAEDKIAILQERVSHLQSTLQETQAMYQRLAIRNEELESLHEMRQRAPEGESH